MARRVDSARFNRDSVFTYPSEWFDGSTWELKRGEDYQCSDEQLRSDLYRMAKAYGHRVRTRHTRDRLGLYIQAIKLNGEPITPPGA